MKDWGPIRIKSRKGDIYKISLLVVKFELLKLCRWHGEFRNCSEMFKPTKTDDGFCCSFNTVSLSEGFVKIGGSEKEQDNQEDDYYDDYDQEDYYNYSEEEYEDENTETEEQEQSNEVENANQTSAGNENDYKEEW